ncbi:hypothetical protein TBLA_0C01770 [Henningerozyma blattae CBS 6284]|uniref:Ribosome biogenesis protein NOP53 n=1 Tax=Henningerozyma blattae (strain ATCC 34711 / CBS 6284 / DSM 70876 / NBRC 10599 / NRRL Y-10934 / UCD 77-7) TaxID=1071380 RepID=I2H0T9_HENB6|nr:hypothetical protein TBLA_0C01770 [Tetrapisispora blattae CBS 6284]CCH59991.1 hypothetical protein TBLA_0C01770 [Tetrapisispora blattae CBS 6284]
MPPINTVPKPAQYKQSSRKGKKSWRKNIDLTDIESGIAENNEKEIHYGTNDLSKINNEQLFKVDSEGDEILKQKLIKRKQIKKNLKSTEILDSIKTNSKVSPLSHPKHDSKSKKHGNVNKKKKVQGVSKKELAKLMALAGRIDGESGIKNRLAKDGLVKSGNNDLWDANEKDAKSDDNTKMLPSGIKIKLYRKNSNKKVEIPEELLVNSSTSWSIPKVKPTTLDIEPVRVKEYKDLPHSGKSYNPASKDWEDLIQEEYELEKVKEDRRISIEEYKTKIAKLIKTLDDDELKESSSDEEDEDESEKEEEEEEDGEIRLSINKKVENKKKTKQQRNKSKRHNEKVSLQQDLKKYKKQLKELERLDEIEKELEAEKKDKLEKVDKKSTIRYKKNHKLGTKHKVREANLEVKFKDELSDSLRKVRPEGNLLYDTVRKLQSTGKMESRVRVAKGRKYKPKITEKWTYKDFK